MIWDFDYAFRFRGHAFDRPDRLRADSFADVSALSRYPDALSVRIELSEAGWHHAMPTGEHPG